MLIVSKKFKNSPTKLTSLNPAAIQPEFFPQSKNTISTPTTPTPEDLARIFFQHIESFSPQSCAILLYIEDLTEKQRTLRKYDINVAIKLYELYNNNFHCRNTESQLNYKQTSHTRYPVNNVCGPTLGKQDERLKQ